MNKDVISTKGEAVISTKGETFSNHFKSIRFYKLLMFMIKLNP